MTKSNAKSYEHVVDQLAAMFREECFGAAALAVGISLVEIADYLRGRDNTLPLTETELSDVTSGVMTSALLVRSMILAVDDHPVTDLEVTEAILKIASIVPTEVTHL